MNSIPFSKWDPSGNITLLFPDCPDIPHAHLASIMQNQRKLCAEQSGFYDLDKKHLRMAGGEFCVNATRSFGALLAFTECCHQNTPIRTRHYTVTVSGWDTPISLTCKEEAPYRFQVTASLKLPKCPIENLSKGCVLVRLPGISHLLLDTATYPLPPSPTEAAKCIIKEHGLKQEPASGVIWWKMEAQNISMVPVVYVRKVDSLFAENACGSGTLALALSIFEDGQGTAAVMQPSGDSLVVSIDCAPEGQRHASITGPVLLAAKGTAFWNDNEVELS